MVVLFHRFITFILPIVLGILLNSTIGDFPIVSDFENDSSQSSSNEFGASMNNNSCAIDFFDDFDGDSRFADFMEVAQETGQAQRVVKAWEFLFDGAGIRVKTNVLESISTALQRGIKDIPDVVNHANHPSIVTRTVEHLFRGHGTNGGRHHISALIADNSRKLVDRLKETSDGFYEAVIKRADGSTSTKSFWPDTWDENKIMDELKHVMANNPVNITGNTWEGFTTTCQKIHYYLKNSDNTIISAFPVL